jgi:hypothetical protein
MSPSGACPSVGGFIIELRGALVRIWLPDAQLLPIRPFARLSRNPGAFIGQSVSFGTAVQASSTDNPNK